MFIPQDNLLEDVKKCMTDPVFNVIKNFSLEKSREYYNKWKKEWDEGKYSSNPAVIVETETFPFANLIDLTNISKEAMTFFNNIKGCDYFREVEWSVCSQTIVVDWYRLKTFDEWLFDGLQDALLLAYQTPEDGVRMILDRELGEGHYTNTMIHMYTEGKINRDTLKRLGQYEKYQHIEKSNLEDDIEQVKKALEDMEENNTIEEIVNMLKRKDTTILKLKK